MNSPIKKCSVGVESRCELKDLIVECETSVEELTIGRIFATFKLAYEEYQLFAHSLGFDYCLSNSLYSSKEKDVMERAKLVYSRAGKVIQNPKKSRAKHSCKCGCEAFICIRQCQGGR